MSKVHSTYFKAKVSQHIKSRTNIQTHINTSIPIPKTGSDDWISSKEEYGKGYANIISGFLKPKSTK